MSKYLSGQWNAICDVCGFKFKSSELQRTWKGLMVCKDDFETRHPQDLIQVRTEKAFPEWTRPRTDDVFKDVCFIWQQSSFVGLGTIGCMKVEYTPLPYATLVEMKG